MLEKNAMKMKRYRLWAVMTLLAGASGLTQAMIVQNISITDIDPTDVGTVDSVVLNQSHAAVLGTTGWAALQSVEISITATVQATVQVENTDMAPPQPVEFTFQFQPNVNVDINGGANLLTGINPQANGSFNAGPPDGSIDFAGSAGTTQNLSGMDSDSTTLTSLSGAPFLAFQGTGTVQLDFTTFLQDLSTIPFILTDPTGKPITVGTLVHDVDITGTVTYTYAPEPGTLVLMVSVFGVAGLLRRRRLRHG